MAPPLNSLERDAHLDAIDLTLSSPEPEERPRQLPQQHRISNYFKKEPGIKASYSSDVENEPGIRSSYSSNVKSEPGTRSSYSSNVKSEFGGESRRLRSIETGRGASTSVPGAHRSQSDTRQINPRHLAEIVKSTDYQVVEAVLLNLCQYSPALSAAVARGLAPHSTFAQSIIRRNQPYSRGPSNINPARDDRNGSHDTRDRMRRRLPGWHSASEVNSSQIRSPSAIAGNQSARPAGALRHSGFRGTQPAGSQSVPSVKRERSPDRGDSDSDLDQYIPREFPVKSEQATPTRLPLRDQDMASKYTSRKPLRHSLSQPAIQNQNQRYREPEVPKQCINCHETVEADDEDGLCFYHPEQQRNVTGETICSSCNKAVTQPGCEIGTHVTKAETEFDTLKRHATNRSPSPSKRPKMG